MILMSDLFEGSLKFFSGENFSLKNGNSQASLIR